MRVRSRVERLERVIEARPVPAFTKKDGVAWSQRFRAHNPANETLWTEIRAWGAEHQRDYLYAGRGDDVPGSEIMKSLFYPVKHMVEKESWVFEYRHSGDEFAPALLRRFADAAYEYQQATGDVYPRMDNDAPIVDWLGGDRAEARHDLIQYLCDLAEKRLADPQHPDVLRWQKALADRQSANAA